MRSVERQYYHDVLIEHKSNLKKSSKIIKSVINKWKYNPSNSKFKYNGKAIDDPFEISNRFNFFVHVGNPKEVSYLSVLAIIVNMTWHSE